jgi:cytoskeletal protein RodZ
VARRYEDEQEQQGRDEGVLPEVEDDLDEESYRRLSGRRRARLVRQRVVFVVVVLVVLAAGGAAALIYTDRWEPGSAATPSAVASTPSCVPATAPAFLAPGEVTVDVLNGTTRRGLAGAVAGELRTRGFVVANVGNAPAATGPGTALVTYPATALQQAVTVGARFAEAQLVADPAATVITVSLGDGYQSLLAEEALVAPALPVDPAAAC